MSSRGSESTSGTRLLSSLWILATLSVPPSHVARLAPTLHGHNYVARIALESGGLFPSCLAADRVVEADPIVCVPVSRVRQREASLASRCRPLMSTGAAGSACVLLIII